MDTHPTQLLNDKHWIVGVDCAGESFVGCRYRIAARRQEAAQDFANQADGFEEFDAWMRRHLEVAKTLVCIEHTGVYSEALAYYLYEHGYDVTLVSPYKIWKASDDGPKNDWIDSRKIAEYARRYSDKITLWKPKSEVAEHIKTLLTVREQLVKQRTASKNTLGALKRKPLKTPTALEALTETIDHLKQQIDEIMREIRRLIDEHPTMSQQVALVVGTPGLGLLAGAHMLVLTNGFTEAPDYRHLAALLGIAPHKRSSGKNVWRPASSRGYGPGMMRKLLHLGARSVVTHKKAFRCYYLRKQAEGKPRALVLNNVSNKLLKIVCAMLRSGQPYIENYRSIDPRRLQTAQYA